MTVPAARTLDNSIDVGRKIPSSALSATVLTELEGTVQEKIVGPDAVGAAPANVRVLSRPVHSIVSILSVVTATGAAGAILAPIDGTHFELLASNADGVGQLTNPSAVDFKLETWIVTYKADAPAETQGGDSSVTP